MSHEGREHKEHANEEVHHEIMEHIERSKREISEQLNDIRAEFDKATEKGLEEQVKELEGQIEALERNLEFFDKTAESLVEGFEGWREAEKMIEQLNREIDETSRFAGEQIEQIENLQRLYESEVKENKELLKEYGAVEEKLNSRRRRIAHLMKEINKDATLEHMEIEDDGSTDETPADKKDRILTKQTFYTGLAVTTIVSLIATVFSGFATALIMEGINERKLNRLTAYLKSIKDLLKAGEISQADIWQAFASKVQESPIMTIDQQINALIMLQLIISDLQIQEDFFWDDVSDMAAKIDALYTAYVDSGKEVTSVYTAAQNLTYNEAEIPVGVVAFLLQACLERIEYKIHHPDPEPDTDTANSSAASGMKSAELVAASRAKLAESPEKFEEAPASAVYYPIQ